ncbi:hypothetical protein H5410_026291 [Solanum commersonii]|uniref:Uncharacterized protein n=1 Tax=Solanum commersonii TaxID=4109 RepID=A0A9J5YYJ2_SOLCO|nr:hypothetical protein H5410_026291 [Solanum commersonii]
MDPKLVPTQIVGTCNFAAIFNFGDSNSDTGGLSAAFGQAPYPNGETFFHAPGRFSDGRLLIDFIAEGLDLPYLSAFLDSIGSNFSHGANFATAGSTIRPQNATMAQSGYSPISLDEISLANCCQRRKTFLKHCTHSISDKMISLSQLSNVIKAYVPDLLSQLFNVIKKVYAKGGRSFWIHNTGPVGCLPYVMDRFMITAAQVDKYGCANPFNEVSKYLNLLLKKIVVQLRKELPLAAFTYVDVYSVKYSLIGHAKKLGFENPFLACRGHGGKYNYNRFIECGSEKVVNGKEIVIASSCKDPSVRVSWDGTHFTKAANKWIFDQIVNGSFSDPPIPLSLACNRLTNYSKNVVLLVLLIVFPFSSAAKSKSSCDFPAVFNFGDSNSDTGGLSAAFGQAGPPAGETYFGTPAGRYCDGRLVIDFIGIPHLSAFLDALGSNFSHGANFATTGSTIRPQNTTLHQSGFSPISLNVQSYEFNDFLHSKLMPKEKHFSQRLYTFDIGQNDLTAGYFNNMSTDQVRAYVPDVIDQFKTVIQGIYSRGGRYFWIHNTGPVGCLPYVLDRLLITTGQVDKAGCASPFNEVAQYLNAKLKEAGLNIHYKLVVGMEDSTTST